MKEINVTVVLTTKCNLACKYCINNSGNDLIADDATIVEWSSASDIIDCLHNLSKIRDIKFIKFFGGEPMLRPDLMMEVIENKHKYSKDGSVKFAFTTNAYEKFPADVLNLLMKNRVILNISLDGPEQLNNSARIARNGGNCFKGVVENLNTLRQNNYPFALICVLDERVLDFDMTVLDISNFLSDFTPIYKIEPAYIIKESLLKKDLEESNVEKILKLQYDFINSVFDGIKSLEEKNYIFENNLLRTLANIVFDRRKEVVCSAGNFAAIFPDKRAYSCYNLMHEEFLISDDLSQIDENILEEKLCEKQKILDINNFPKEYKEIELYGDYCPRENNFNSFAFLYRKHMIENISAQLQLIKPGSPEHLSLVNYINKGYSVPFFDNFDKANSII